MSETPILTFHSVVADMSLYQAMEQVASHVTDLRDLDSLDFHVRVKDGIRTITVRRALQSDQT